MLYNQLKIWKRKQAEVEERIQKLKEIKEQILVWRTTAAQKRKSLLWDRKKHKEFIHFTEARMRRIAEENARKLSHAQSELQEISQQIELIKNCRRKVISTAAVGITLMLIMGFFVSMFQPTITGYSIFGQDDSSLHDSGDVLNTSLNITDEIITPPMLISNDSIIESNHSLGIIPDINESRNIPRGWFVNGSFMKSRQDRSSLPEGWFIQSGGQSEEDNGCANISSWQLSNESYHERRSIIYTPELDQYTCGIKLPSFNPEMGRNYTIEFYFKENFTNMDSALEILNNGNDDCDVKFNSHSVVEERGCHAEMMNITVGNLTSEWKKMSISWPILKGEKADLFFTPPHALNDSGSIILESVIVEEEER